MLLAALAMPIVAVFYFATSDMAEITPLQFYKWSALSYTPWIILPLVLGMLCTMLMYDEKQNDMLKQLWIVPVSKTGFLLGKFAVVWAYSICFMLLAAIGSVLAGRAAGLIEFANDSVSFLFVKCLEIGALTPFAMMPVLAVAASRKSYILPACVTIVYTFLGFIMMMVNMYIHPLSSSAAIFLRDIEGVALDQPVHPGKAFLCIGAWGAAAMVFARVALSRGTR